MGVGKTLTAISVVWAFVRKGGRKALIVCPSSLVDNWIKEIKHWLGTKLKPLTLKAGADAGALINTFAISMATLYPVMVLSYEVSISISYKWMCIVYNKLMLNFVVLL